MFSFGRDPNELADEDEYDIERAMICLDLCEKAVSIAKENDLVRCMVLYRIVCEGCECCAEMRLALLKMIWPVS